MNKLLKTATFTFAVIATINIFSACSKEENTPSINIGLEKYNMDCKEGDDQC